MISNIKSNPCWKSIQSSFTFLSRTFRTETSWKRNDVTATDLKKIKKNLLDKVKGEIKTLIRMVDQFLTWM